MSAWLALVGALGAAPLPAHAAPTAVEVGELLDRGQPERARRRCRPEVRSPSGDAAVRELCAQAYWADAVRAGTVDAWAAYRDRWDGTRPGAEALNQEARAALGQLGEVAAEADYRAWIARYGDTALAPRASALAAGAALRGVFDADDARGVVARWPGLPGLVDLVARFPAELVTLRVIGDDVVAEVDPAVPLAGPPSARWVAPGPAGDVPWAEAAAAHVAALGLPAAGLPGAWPPCPAPGLPLAVELNVAGARAVVPHAGPTRCREAWPTFVVVRGGRAAAIVGGPDASVDLALPGEAAVRGDGTRIPLVADPGPLGLVGAFVVQPLGALALWTPLSGELPFYAPGAEGAIPLPEGGPEGVALADGWRLDGREVSGPAGASWTLPEGEARALTPVFALASGLHRGGALSPLVPDAPTVGPRGQAPPGSAPVPLAVVPWREVRELGRALVAMGLPIAASRAWRPDAPGAGTRAWFDGTWRGRPVRGVVDPGASRVWVWEAPAATGISAFRTGGGTWVAWAHPDGAVDLVRDGASGLTRQLRPR